MQDDAGAAGGRPDEEETVTSAPTPELIAGRYRVIRRLGSGAMGEVFEVAHPSLPRNEAVKLVAAVFASDPDFKARFLREADVMATLMHPNIVTVFDRGEDESGRMWLAMELVNGEDAAQLLAEHGPMPLSLVADIVAGAGAALDFAWRTRRVTHRDVKPANIMVGLDDRGSAELVKLADFGIAKATAATELTATGLMVGTLAYMSPEAFEGQVLDGFADQYSLGCTAFALLTGRSPFAADSQAAMIAGHMSKPVPAITALRPDLPAALDAVFARVLAKEPNGRFDSCVQFADAIRATVVSSPSSAAANRIATKQAPLAPPERLLSGPASAEFAADPEPFGPTQIRASTPAVSERGRAATHPRRAILMGGVVAVTCLLAVVAIVAMLLGGGPDSSPPLDSTANEPATSTTPNSDGSTIAVSQATAVALNPDGATAYVGGGNSVSVIDTATNTVTASILVGTGLNSVAVAPKGTTIYVTNELDGSVSVVDTATNAVVATIPVGQHPRGAAVSPNGASVYVTNYIDGTVSVIDTATNAVTATIPAGEGSDSVAVTPNGTAAYVVNSDANSVSVIDIATNVVTATIPVGQDPDGVAVTPNGAAVVIANRGGSSVSIVDTATGAVTATIPVGQAPGNVVVAPGGGTVYVINEVDGSLSVVDIATNTVARTLPVGDDPGGVALTPNGSAAYIAHYLDGTVSTISLK